MSRSPYASSSVVATAVPFDNSTNGFVSTDVQSAIEEARAFLSTPSIDQNYYVAKNGSDTTGNGSIGYPYLTIGKALTVITDSSPTKRYVITVGPGDYNENLVLKANIFIKGSGPISTRLTGTTLNINDATWNVAAADNRSGFQDMSVNPTCTFDFTTQTNNTDGKLYFFNIRNSGAWTLTANNAINQLIVQDSEIFGTTTLNGMNTYISATTWQSGNIVLNSSGAAGIPAILTLAGGSITGNITATWTSNQPVTLNLAGIAIGPSTVLTASGASCTVNAIHSSLPIPANRSFTSSAVLVRLNDNYALGLLSATTNVNCGSATAPTSGQVLTATSSTTAVWASPIVGTHSDTTATANATTASGTDAVITGMTVTPTVGTYLVMFSAAINSNNAGSTQTISFYVGGVQRADSVRKISPFDGGTLSALNASCGVAIQGIVTVTGSQAIAVEWSTNGGTAICGPRCLSIVQIG